MAPKFPKELSTISSLADVTPAILELATLHCDALLQLEHCSTPGADYQAKLDNVRRFSIHYTKDEKQKLQLVEDAIRAKLVNDPLEARWKGGGH